ncbi:MAG: hypothetical protein A2096_10820 [Spirochaetes bacterium GWF1_41_5]|nr:MAG: hypothetical protein A2096_10820 [Spirochaetes bacterium GWF1_41_5]HBE03521.1 hypothetical protein [Spirochaetia bacterium]
MRTKIKRYLWEISIIASTLMHLAVFLLFIRKEIIPDNFANPEQAMEMQVLADFDRTEVEDIEKELKAAYVSDRNFKAQGKNTDEKRLNIINNTSKIITEQKSDKDSSLIKLNKSGQSESRGNKPQSEQSEEQAEKESERGNLPTYITLDDNTRIEIHFDDRSEMIKAGSESYEYAEFTMRFARTVQRSFSNIIFYNKFENFYLVSGDRVAAICSIDRQGYIDFRKMILESAKQPFFNYLAEKTLAYAGNTGEVPDKLFRSRMQTQILIPVHFIFTGSPKNTWLFGVPRFE